MKQITVILKTTSECNLKCPYCYTRHTIQKKELMSLEIFEKTIQSICLDYDFLNLTFHGGEALLVPLEWYIKAIDILKKYQKLYKFSYKLAMQSNITLMNEEYNNFFIKEDIKIGFSYDGLNNEKTRKNSEIIINNKNKYETVGGCICLITKDNINNIVNEIKHFEELKISATFNIIFNTKEEIKGDLVDIKKEEILDCYKKAFEYIITREKTYCDFNFDVFLNKIKNKKGRMVCSRIKCASNWISVHPNGDVYPCGQEWDIDKKYLLGNINKNDFKECFESTNFLNFKSKIEKKIEKCKKIKCEVFDICSGGCPGENKSNGKDVDSFIEKHCYFNQEFYKYLKEYLANLDFNKIKNKHIKKILGESLYE